MTDLRCGVYLPNFGAFGDARVLAATAAAAEAAGWDGCFIWDHVARPLALELVDPWWRWRRWRCRPPASASVHWSPRWPAGGPGRSRGRPSLSIGCRAAAWCSAPASAAAAASNGTTSAMRPMPAPAASCSTKASPSSPGCGVVCRLSFAGAHYHVRDACFLPPPLQSPRIPVWLAGHWPNRRPFERAARWDGIFPEFPHGGDEPAQLRKWSPTCVRGARTGRRSTSSTRVHRMRRRAISRPTPPPAPRGRREHQTAALRRRLDRCMADRAHARARGRWTAARRTMNGAASRSAR